MGCSTPRQGPHLALNQLPVAQPLAHHAVSYALHLREGVGGSLIVSPRELADVAVEVLGTDVVEGGRRSLRSSASVASKISAADSALSIFRPLTLRQ